MKSSSGMRSSRVLFNAFGPVARMGAAVLLVGAAPLLAACNGVTGAGDLVFNDGGGGNGGDDGWGSGAQTGVTSGAGAGSTTGAGATTGSGATGSTAASGNNCVYPTPTQGYGAMTGSVIRPNLTWQGYREGGATTVSDIAITEYFDCDGTKGINALFIATSATWCGNCQQEASQLENHMVSSWQAMGIKIITLMIEDIDGSPGTTQTALNWRNQFGLNSASVTADPSFSMAGGGGTIGLPLLHVVDPRTMTVVDRQEGYSGNHAKLENLALQNGP